MTRSQDIVISKLIEMAGEGNNLQIFFERIAMMIANFEKETFHINYVEATGKWRAQKFYQGKTHFVYQHVNKNVTIAAVEYYKKIGDVNCFVP